MEQRHLEVGLFSFMLVFFDSMMAVSDVALAFIVIGDDDGFRVVGADVELLQPIAILELEFDPFDELQLPIVEGPNRHIHAILFVEDDRIHADLELCGKDVVGIQLNQVLQNRWENVFMSVEWVEVHLVGVTLDQKDNVGVIEWEMKDITLGGGNYFLSCYDELRVIIQTEIIAG